MSRPPAIKPRAKAKAGAAKPPRGKPAQDKRDIFIRQYLIHKNKTKAYREAGFNSPPHTERQNAHRVFTSEYVQDRITEAREENLRSLDVKVTDVFDRFKAIAFGDAAAITKYITGACRYCHGIDHRYQWRTQREFADAMEAYMGKGETYHANHTAPDCEGGFGYMHKTPPHPDCPECEGEGVDRVRFKPTQLMTEDERKLFAGVKVTQHGIEFKLNDQMAALKELAEHLQFYKERDETNANAIAVLLERMREASAIGRMPLRKDEPKADGGDA